MNNDKISIDYEGLESDISTLASNIEAITSSLNNVNSVEKAIPDSWQSAAADQFRSCASSAIVSPIAGIQESFNQLKETLQAVLDKYKSTETIIKSNAPTYTYPGTPSGSPYVPTVNHGTPSDLTTEINAPVNNPTMPSNLAGINVENPSFLAKNANNAKDVSVTENELNNLVSDTNDLDINEEGLDNPAIIPNIPTNKPTQLDKTPQQPIKSSNNAAKGVASTIIGLGVAGAAGAAGYGIYKKKKRDAEDEDEYEDEESTREYNIPTEEQ